MTELSHSLRTPAALAAAGLKGTDQAAELEAVTARYAMAITPTMAALIDPRDPNDPIARQFVPDPRELATTQEENADPIGDARHSPFPGLVHRHHDRVLLKIVRACPVYCRFCFRREMVGPGREVPADLLARAGAYVAAHPEIWEVILTGGDPFMLGARRAAEATRVLGAIAHVKVLRWHTRVPAVDPQRVTEALVAALKSDAVTPYVVLHANHPRELTLDAARAIARIVDAGIPMLSQSVLLRGVNDDLAVLEALMHRLVELRVKPYYLHHADLAPGTAHLRTTLAEGQALMRALKSRLSGLAQPSYVVDIPGGYAKVAAAAPDVAPAGVDRARLRDGEGRWHNYPPAPTGWLP